MVPITTTSTAAGKDTNDNHNNNNYSSTEPTATATTTSFHKLDGIIRTQLNQLDDTDYYATAWSDALIRYNNSNSNDDTGVKKLKWGGRGQGGRGVARRTYQKKDIIVDNICLEYCITTKSSSSTSAKNVDAAGSATASLATTGEGTTTAIAKATTKGQASSVSSSSSVLLSSSSSLLLDHATLKLLHGHVYALIGPSGCGKSTLLRRIASGKIPGFPPHITTLYIPQEMILLNDCNNNNNNNVASRMTPIDFIIQRHSQYAIQSVQVSRAQLEQYEKEMESLNVESVDDQIKIEELANCISQIEDEIEETNACSDNNNNNNNDTLRKLAQDSLRFVGVSCTDWTKSLTELSEGILKKISLAVALSIVRSSSSTRCIDLLLLDEPTSGLDVNGLLMLRQLISTIINHNNNNNEDEETTSTNQSTTLSSTTILFISHDIDFINSVATDVIDMYDQSLRYYGGNYANYKKQYQQSETTRVRAIETLDKKRENIKQTISNLKKKKNTRKQIESHRKRFEREINEDYDPKDLKIISSRTRTISRFGEGGGEIDKKIQFSFRKVVHQWHEPLIMTMDLGYGYNIPIQPETKKNKKTELEMIENQLQQMLMYDNNNNNNNNNRIPMITKKDGYLFDCVDLCIEEGGIYCILGSNSCGKTTLLKLLAKVISPPVEGKVVYAHNVDVAYIDQEYIDSFFINNTKNNNVDKDVDGLDGKNSDVGQQRQNKQQDGETLTAFQYLTNKYPQKTNQEIRGELTSFGLSTPQQVSGTPICFLSGGERRRLCIADCMLSNPQVLILDEPTSNLDVESVDALIDGLNKWNGTVVMSSHDFNFLRSIQAKCYVLIPEEGKLRRLDGGIDTYLKSFVSRKNIPSLG